LICASPQALHPLGQPSVARPTGFPALRFPPWPVKCEAYFTGPRQFRMKPRADLQQRSNASVDSLTPVRLIRRSPDLLLLRSCHAAVFLDLPKGLDSPFGLPCGSLPSGCPAARVTGVSIYLAHSRKLDNFIELPRDLVCSHPGSQSPAGLPTAPFLRAASPSRKTLPAGGRRSGSFFVSPSTEPLMERRSRGTRAEGRGLRQSKWSRGLRRQLSRVQRPEASG
jgi:hypothetical protein